MSFGFIASYVALWVLVIFQGLLALALFRQVSDLGARERAGDFSVAEELEPGSLAPAFSGSDVHSGRRIDIKSLNRRGGALLFVSAHCAICRTLADSMPENASSDDPLIIMVCVGRGQSCERFARRFKKNAPLLLQSAEEIAAAYRISEVPTAVVVDGELKISVYAHPKDWNELAGFMGHRSNEKSIEDQYQLPVDSESLSKS